MNSKKGFTLIELLAVIILIIGIMLIVLPKITGSVKNKEVAINTSYENIIFRASDLYISDNSSKYPKVTTNTYCIAVDTLKKKGYLKDYDNDNVKTKSIVKVTYSGGYYYEMVDECTEQIIDYDKCTEEGKCSACMVLSNYDPTKEIYKYTPKIVKDTKLDTLLDVTIVTNNDECIKEAIISAAREFVLKYPDKFVSKVGNIYCIKVSTLISENMLDLGTFTSYNNLPVTDYSVEVKYSQSKFLYDVKLKGECKVNIVSTCIATISGGNSIYQDHRNHPEWTILGSTPKLDENNKLIFDIGDEYYCNIDGIDKTRINNDELLFGRYNVISIDTENKLVNLMSETDYKRSSDDWITESDFNNLKAKFGYSQTGICTWLISKREYYCGNNVYGPVSIMKQVYNLTKNWNIPNINLNFRDQNNADDSSKGYYGIYTIGDTTYILDRYASNSSDISHATFQATNLKARYATRAEIKALENAKKTKFLDVFTISRNYETGKFGLSVPEEIIMLDSSGTRNHYLRYSGNTSDSSGSKITSEGIDNSWGYSFRPVISIPMSDIAPFASSTNDLSY